MNSLLLAILGVAAGLFLLAKSSGVFVRGAAVIAQRLGVSQMVIGIVIVGFGTSTPELLVSTIAAYQDNAGIALGNVYGSNIFNIALILGVGGLIGPIVISRQFIRKDWWVELAVTIICALVLYLDRDGVITRFGALIFLISFGGLIWWTMRGGAAPEEKIIGDWTLRQAIIWTFVGLAVMMGSSYLLIWGAKTIATFFGVSDLVIGLTVVALGTSLPELASSVVAIRQKNYDLAVGNIMGSYLFNALLIVGVSGMVSPLKIERDILVRDFPLMAGLLILLFMLSIDWRRRSAPEQELLRAGKIGRVSGAVLLAIYVGYTLYLFSAAPTS